MCSTQYILIHFNRPVKGGSLYVSSYYNARTVGDIQAKLSVTCSSISSIWFSN